MNSGLPAILCVSLLVACAPVRTLNAGDQVDFPTVTNRSIARIGDDLFVVTFPLSFQLAKGQPPIVVPKGFVTDLASIPKAVQWWEGKVDRSMAPAIVHDYLYWYRGCAKREQADAVMWRGMTAMKMNWAEPAHKVRRS